MDEAILLMLGMALTSKVSELLKKESKDLLTKDEINTVMANASFELLKDFTQFEEDKKIDQVNLPNDLLN